MAHMVMAAFTSQAHADEAVRELETSGYDPKNISLITKERTGTADDGPAAEAVEGATSGAVTGTAVGGLAGLLAGAGVIPALAGLLIGGPVAAFLGATGVIATTISGAVTGAVAGGLIGALVKLGLPEETATSYNDIVEDGGMVVGVPVEGDRQQEVMDIMDAHSAQDVTIVETHEHN
jgi:hypothetical protein